MTRAAAPGRAGRRPISSTPCPAKEPGALETGFPVSPGGGIAYWKRLAERPAAVRAREIDDALLPADKRMGL